MPEAQRLRSFLDKFLEVTLGRCRLLDLFHFDAGRFHHLVPFLLIRLDQRGELLLRQRHDGELLSGEFLHDRRIAKQALNIDAELAT